MGIYDLESGEYNNKLAEALKKIPEIEAPEWAALVKTSVSKARPPQEDWWHKRTASILRQIYIHGVVGVSRLRTKYGSKKNRGSRPGEFRKSSGKIIRLILQQAEKAGFLEKSEGKKKGRKLTSKGVKFLEGVK
ncbi:MAG: 40S ribosomal protein S19 [Nanoarchaeota archaeon]